MLENDPVGDLHRTTNGPRVAHRTQPAQIGEYHKVGESEKEVQYEFWGF